MNLIDNQILVRSTRAIKCLALNQNFYKDIDSNGLTAKEVLDMKEKYLKTNLHRFQSSEALEDTFRWLIILGVLRREVDGQGLTSKVRLTPLGRQILVKCPELPIQKANFFEKATDFLVRIFSFL
ncbi:Npun_F0494 family protein [Prochlorococcus marinus]|uniref:Uncharacterized protein n=1 Tax=Prochlorococcus marinus (strain MIT 9211) TaxID=93059 RepID=A9BBF5_PROM4|nr:Npun_F0494 family protein [Prochlorococcus marinus]ABX09167.1 Hypothetical protein P9211_12361 [Prochlorococcus marinus str. MIT 9211]